MIAVVGAKGTIGSAVVGFAKGAGIEAIGFSRDGGNEETRIDLGNKSTWVNLPDDADSVLISAGVSDLKECRRRPNETRRINVTATAEFVRFAARRGCFPMVVSSSYVFDGSKPDFGPGDPTCPSCEYGRQKADLEAELSKCASDCAVVRLTKVFGESSPLLSWWKKSLLGGDSIIAAEDARLSPLTASFVARGLVSILQGRHAGLWQLSASDDVSWYDIAVLLAQKCGLPEGAVARSCLRDIDPSAEFVPHRGSLKVVWPGPLELPRSILAVEELLENISASQ